MAVLVVLMLLDPSARNQVIAVLVLTAFLVVASRGALGPVSELSASSHPL